MQKVLQMAVLLDVAEVVFQPLLRLDQIPFDQPLHQQSNAAN